MFQLTGGQTTSADHFSPTRFPAGFPHLLRTGSSARRNAAELSRAVFEIFCQRGWKTEKYILKRKRNASLAFLANYDRYVTRNFRNFGQSRARRKLQSSRVAVNFINELEKGKSTSKPRLPTFHPWLVPETRSFLLEPRARSSAKLDPWLVVPRRVSRSCLSIVASYFHGVTRG